MDITARGLNPLKYKCFFCVPFPVGLLGTKLRISCDLPVVVLEPGPPVGCPEKGLEGASQIHEAVAHQEEHGEQRSDLVDVA